MYRVVFMGTPDFAVPTLQALHDHSEFEVVGVVTQPDRKAGRGRKVRQSAVKKRALSLGLPLHQPPTLRRDDAMAKLRTWFPDVIVVAAFGQILRRDVLNIPMHGCVNVHASLLPRWRGAAPIQYAVRAGDRVSGVTIMRMDEGLDTGPMLVSKAVELAPDETAGTLHDKLAALGAELLPAALIGYLTGVIHPAPQPDEKVTLAPSLKKEQGLINWFDPAEAIDRQVRAYDPWPGTFSYFEGDLLKIHAGSPLPDLATDYAPGTLVEGEGSLGVQTGEGVYLLHEVQPAGKRAMSTEAFLAGRPDVFGEQLHSAPPTNSPSG